MSPAKQKTVRILSFANISNYTALRVGGRGAGYSWWSLRVGKQGSRVFLEVTALRVGEQGIPGGHCTESRGAGEQGIPGGHCTESRGAGEQGIPGGHSTESRGAGYSWGSLH